MYLKTSKRRFNFPKISKNEPKKSDSKKPPEPKKLARFEPVKIDPIYISPISSPTMPDTPISPILTPPPNIKSPDMVKCEQPKQIDYMDKGQLDRLLDELDSFRDAVRTTAKSLDTNDEQSQVFTQITIGGPSPNQPYIHSCFEHPS